MKAKTSRFIVMIMVALLSLCLAVPAFATGYPKNCWDVKKQNPYAADGYYTIEPFRGKAFTVYCIDKKAYLPLVYTGGDYNYSQYTAGYASPGTDVRTNYTKVRIDPLTFIVDMSDTTFSESTGLLCHSVWNINNCTEANEVTSMPYAQAADCLGPSSAAGSANIDLSGTPFAVDDVFDAFGYHASATITTNGTTTNLSEYDTVHVTSQVVDMTGGGYCGYMGSINSYYHKLLQLKWNAE